MLRRHIQLHKYSVETMSLYTDTQGNKMNTPIIAYIQKMFDKFSSPNPYGTELEQYIASKNPQSTYDVEYWTNQYDKKQNERTWV